MKTMLVETKLKNDMLVAKHEELEKQGMNDGDGDG
jgi:BMFP domain-containing protein YqiC